MSTKAVKFAVAKKRKTIRSGAGLISELYVKEYDAQNRLGGSCCVFIKVKDEVRLLIISDNVPEFRDSEQFFSVAIGASTSELGEARDILNELSASVADLYSPQDFHSTVALYFISRYLKGVMEEFWLPRALAVEYMIFDPMFNVLHTIKFNGGYESYSFEEDEKTFILMGGYNMRLRRELARELKKIIDKGNLDNETLQKLGDKLSKKYGLRVSALLHPEVIRASPSVAKNSASTPGSQSD